MLDVKWGSVWIAIESDIRLVYAETRSLRVVHEFAQMGEPTYDNCLMRWFADFLYLIVGLLYLPVAAYNALLLGKNRHGWRERFGGLRRFDKDRQRIWIHAVSLGEINCTPLLVKKLRDQLPDVDIVISTTTDTGFARAVQLFGPRAVFRFPLDFSLAILRALDRINPSLIVLVELEVWYNLIHQANRRGIPIAIVNGRLTQRSARRLAWIGAIGRSMFARLTWVGAQDQAIASRFCALGTPSACVEMTSSLKWDTATVGDHVEGADALASAMAINRTKPLWVCGSTGPAEEAIVLEAYKIILARCPESRHAPMLAIVPRKPERFDEVAKLIRSVGYACIRRSDRADGCEVPSLEDSPIVILGDTMGELRKFYALANVVFVGRSLVPMGGSDPMEVAAMGKPMIVGPHMDNFALPVAALRQAQAILSVPNANELAEAVIKILTHEDQAQALSNNARRVVKENQGATDLTVQKLASFLR